MRIVFIVFAWLCHFASPVFAGEKLAVLDLSAKYGVEKNLAAALSVLLRDEIQKLSKYEVMSKDDLIAIAERQALQEQAGECDDNQCLVAYGRALGTKYMIAGDISRLGETYSISVRLLDTEGAGAGVKKRVNERCKCNEEGLFATIEVVATKILANSVDDFTTKNVADEKAAAEKAVAERIASAEKAAAERITAVEKAFAEKLAAGIDDFTTKNVAAEKAAAERSAAEKIAADEKAAAEKAAAERIAAAEKAAAERITAAEKAFAEKLAAGMLVMGGNSTENSSLLLQRSPEHWDYKDIGTGLTWRFFRGKEVSRIDAENICAKLPGDRKWQVPSRKDFDNLITNPSFSLPVELPKRYFTLEVWDGMTKISAYQLNTWAQTISYFDFEKNKPGSNYYLLANETQNYFVTCVTMAR